MNKISGIWLALAITLAGVAIVTKHPFTDIWLGWIWIVWGLVSVVNIILYKKLKWWKL